MLLLLVVVVSLLLLLLLILLLLLNGDCVIIFATSSGCPRTQAVDIVVMRKRQFVSHRDIIAKLLIYLLICRLDYCIADSRASFYCIG